MVAGGRGRSLEVVGGRGWPPVAKKMAEKCPIRPTARNRGYFGPLWSFFWWVATVEVVGCTKGSRWRRWVAKNGSERSRQKIAQAGQEGWFVVIFRSLADSLYTKHELGFIVDIASFQLMQN